METYYVLSCLITFSMAWYWNLRTTPGPHQESSLRNHDLLKRRHCGASATKPHDIGKNVKICQNTSLKSKKTVVSVVESWIRQEQKAVRAISACPLLDIVCHSLVAVVSIQKDHVQKVRPAEVTLRHSMLQSSTWLSFVLQKGVAWVHSPNHVIQYAVKSYRLIVFCVHVGAPQCNEATSKMAASPKLRLHGLFEALPWLDSAQAELPLVGEESKHAFHCFPIFPSNGKKLEKLDVELHGSAILTDQSR